MNIEKIAYQTGVDAPSANLKLFADLVIKNYHDENYQVRTDNTQLIANMEAKIAELEAKNHTIGDESIYMVCQHQALEITELNHKLTIAIEALECALSDDKPYILKCKEALNKIRGE
jgi:hypothetical protein